MPLINLRGRDRYEVDGKTIVFVPAEWLTPPQWDAILTKDRVTFSAKNEKTYHEFDDRYIDRSIMQIVGHKEIPSGVNVELTLDIMALPTSRRQIDGAAKRNY